jgi:hypothetical protein
MAETFDRVVVQVDTETGREMIEVLRTESAIQVAVRDKERGLGTNFYAEYSDITRTQSARELAIAFIKRAYEITELEIQEVAKRWMN